MNKYDEYINSFIDSLPEDNSNTTYNALLSEALFTVQKATEQTKIIKAAITSEKITRKTAELLLLCVKLEMINSSLTQIRHEYNL